MTPTHLSKLTIASCWVAAIAFSGLVAIPHQVDKDASGLIRIPFCTQDGGISFMTIKIGQQDTPPQAPQKEQAACHGPCICNRKKTATVHKPPKA